MKRDNLKTKDLQMELKLSTTHITLRSGKEMHESLSRICSKINGPHNWDEQLLYDGLQDITYDNLAA